MSPWLRFAEKLVHVAHDPDNLAPVTPRGLVRANKDAPTHGARSREMLGRKGLVNDGDRRGFRRVRRTKLPPLEQGNPHGREVSRTDTDVAARELVGDLGHRIALDRIVHGARKLK